MKLDNDNLVVQTNEVSRQASHRCCLARMNSLLNSLRSRHDRAAEARLAANPCADHPADSELQAPSLHDIFAGELEAAFASEGDRQEAAIELAIAYDSPREVARARLIFSATLAVPLILIAASLTLFEAELGRASTSLLKFCALALATPLILALAGSAFRSGWQGILAHPVLALAGVVATGSYAGSAFAMGAPGAGSSLALMLSMAGLLAVTVYLGHWNRARKQSP